jgi:hypothetical protein
MPSAYNSSSPGNFIIGPAQLYLPGPALVLAAPTGLAVTPVASGGTFGASSVYYWKITALNSAGESLGSNEVNATVVLNGSAVLTWPAVTGATGYKVYRGTTLGGESVYYTVGAVTTYTDTNAASTAGTVPVSIPIVSQPWAVSRGGFKFDPGITWRQAEFDGKRSDIMGGDRIIGFAPVLSGVILVLNPAVLAALEPGSVSATVSTVTTITPLAADVMLVSANYLSNLRALFKLGNGTYEEISFAKALITKWSLNTPDKSEGEISVEFRPRLDTSVGGSTTDDAPYKHRLIPTPAS